MAAKQIIDDLDAYNGLDSSIRSSLFDLLEKFGFKDITNNHGDPYQIDFQHANSKLSSSQMNSLLETSNKFFNALLDRLVRIIPKYAN